MKKLIILFTSMLIFGVLYAQDLIVTTDKDSIDCKILMIQDRLIYFDVMQDGEEIKTYLPLDRVKSYSYSKKGDGNSYQIEYVKAKMSNPHTPLKKDNYARFRVAVAGGYTYRTPKVPDDFPDDYRRKLKNGYHYGAEFNYYFNEFLGMGINYYASRFSPEFDDYVDNIRVRILDKIRIQQIMPTFNVRVYDRTKRGAFLASIGIGYVDYKDKICQADLNNLHFGTIKGGTVGMLWSIGYDIPLSQTLAIYVQASLTGGVVTKFTFIDEITGETKTAKVDDANNGEGLGKINLSVGLRFAK